MAHATADMPEFNTGGGGADNSLASIQRSLESRRGTSVPQQSSNYYDLDNLRSVGGGSMPLSSLARPRRQQHGIQAPELSDLDQRPPDDEGDQPDSPANHSDQDDNMFGQLFDAGPTKKKTKKRKEKSTPPAIIRDSNGDILRAVAKRNTSSKRKKNESSEAEEDNNENADGEEDVPEIEYLYIRERKARAPEVQSSDFRFGNPKPQEECVGCTHMRDDVAKPGFEQLQQMARMFNTNMANRSIVVLAESMAIFYRENIQKKANRPGAIQEGETPMPDWDAATIHEHFTRHVNEFGVRRAIRMQMVDNIIMQLYKEEAWREVETEPGSSLYETKLSQPTLKQLKEWLKLEAQLYGQDARRAMFSSGGIGLPTEDYRAMLQMQKPRVSVRNAARITGTSNASTGSNAGVGGTIQGAGAGGNGNVRSSVAGAAKPRSSGWG